MSMPSRIAILALSMLLFLRPAYAVDPPLYARNVTVLKLSVNSPAGGGVLIAPDLVLTAAHVVHASVVQVACGLLGAEGTQIIPAVVRGHNEKADLALLELLTPCKGVAVSEVSDIQPAVGVEDVFAVGCPEGYCGRVTRGVVTSYEQGRLVTDAKTWFGSSGGGLFTKDGKLVGICSMIHVMSDPGDAKNGVAPYSQVFGIFIPSHIIKAFLMVTFMEMKQQEVGASDAQ